MLKIHATHPIVEKYFKEEEVYRTNGCGAFDVIAAFPVGDGRNLDQGHVHKIPLGFRMEVPTGYVALMTPRSGLANRGLTLWNSPGVIDSDYRGEVSALLYIHPGAPILFGDTKWWLRNGKRIAQIMLVKYSRPMIHLTNQLSDTERGEGGFGSTGI